MTVTVYKSTDASAPVLRGVAGDLVALLDAILVNGYGSKAAAAWSIAFTGTNKRAYKQPVGTNGRYLRVVDDGTTSAAYGRVQGYITMSDVDTGTNSFPNQVTQIAQPGLYCHKSATADTTARPWACYSNGAIFHLIIWTDQTSITALTPIPGTVTFGDYLAYNLADPYNTILIAGTTTVATVSTTNNHQFCIAAQYVATNGAQPMVGHYVPQNWNGIGGAQLAIKMTNNGLLGFGINLGVQGMGQGSSGGALTSVSTLAGMQYPNPTDNGLYQERLWICLTTGVVLGELPGMWAPLQPRPLTMGDTFAGQGVLSGKNFEVVGLNLAATAGQVFMETSNTW